MSSLVVLAFPDEHGAQNVLAVVNDLQKQRLITIDDAATVVRGRGGKPKVQQATSLVGEGAWGGAFWGMLFGLLFFVPFLGLPCRPRTTVAASSMVMRRCFCRSLTTARTFWAPCSSGKARTTRLLTRTSSSGLGAPLARVGA